MSASRFPIRSLKVKPRVSWATARSGIVESIVVEGFGTYLEEHPTDARRIIDKALAAARAREAARKARELTVGRVPWRSVPSQEN